MVVGDIVFMIAIAIWILFFTTAAIVWRGIWFFGILSGLGWFLAGFYFFARFGALGLMYQREMSLVFIGVGIAMTLSPFWLKAKQADLESNAPDDINIWGEKKSTEDREQESSRKRSRDNIDRMKQDRRRRY
jgi:hypothetical protein